MIGAKAAQSTQMVSGIAIVRRVTAVKIIETRPPIRLVYKKPTGPSKAASINAVRGDLSRFIANSHCQINS